MHSYAKELVRFSALYCLLLIHLHWAIGIALGRYLTIVVPLAVFVGVTARHLRGAILARRQR